jgi:hypothetical protein
MRVWTVLVPALLVAAALPAGGRAEEASGQDQTLRGGFDPETEPLSILPALEAEPAATATMPEPEADDLQTGKALPEQEPARATNPDPDDELTTAGVRKAPEDDPFAALGIRAGGFILFPSVEFSAGYSTNAEGVAGTPGSGFWIVAPELEIRSDWAEHEATLTMGGSYQEFTDGVTEAQPEASIDATGRIDLPAEWTTDLSAGYSFQNQSVSDPNFPAGVDEAPGVHDLIATASVNGPVGKLDLTVAGTVERTIYENAMSGDTVVDQGDRTNNRYATRVRVGYALTPAITPFVEGELGWRVYDRPIDDSGIARSSRSEAVRVGIAYDDAPILKGEVAVGVRREVFDDPGLATLSALTVDGSLAWAPTRLTTVTFDASTVFNPSTDPASSGSIAYDASVELAYAWRRNVTIKGKVAFKDERFQGIDLENRTYDASLGWVWKLNRTLQVTAEYVHEWLDSSDASANYESDTVKVGLKVQR